MPNLDPQALIIDTPQAHRYLVNKRAFVDPGLFAREMEAVYGGLWLYVGHETEIPQPGDFISRTVAGRPLLFVRGSDGAARVFLNTCTHNGAKVCREDFGNRRHFPCAYHGWVFDHDGRLLDVPGEAAFGPQFDKAAEGLIAPPSQASYRGFTFVSFAQRDDLVAYLAGAAQYLDILCQTSAAGMRVLPGTHVYSTRANWKMLPVNVIDGNHFMPTHVTYLQYLRERGSELSEPIRDFHEAHLGNGHTVFEYEAPWGRPQGKPDAAWSDAVNAQIAARRQDLIERLGPELGDRIARKNRNLVIFPNLIINDIMGTTIRVAEPISADYMEVSAWQLCPADDPPELAHVRNEQFLTFLGPGGFATPDDIEGMEASQRGYACYREAPWINYSKGIAAELAGGFTRPGESDFMMRAFFNAWRDYLGMQQFTEAA